MNQNNDDAQVESESVNITTANHGSGAQGTIAVSGSRLRIVDGQV